MGKKLQKCSFLTKLVEKTKNFGLKIRNKLCNLFIEIIFNSKKGFKMYEHDIIEMENFSFNHYIHHFDDYEDFHYNTRLDCIEADELYLEYFEEDSLETRISFD